MVAEWSAECAIEDPVLVVPWKDESGVAEFIDLRANPYDLYLVPEVEDHSALMQALRALNAPRSPVFTAKCDVWIPDALERESMLFNLDLSQESAQAAFASYIDVVWRDRAIFASRHRSEQVLDRLIRLATALDAPNAMFECVLRPAVVDFGDPQEGFAVSVYLKAVGSDLEHARDEWGRALAEIVRLFRSREFTPR